MKLETKRLLKELLDQIEEPAHVDYEQTGKPDNHAFSMIKRLRIELELADGFFPITSVCRDDIRHAFDGRDNCAEACQRIDKMTDADMAYLAGKMANDYLEQLYWDSLRILFEELFLRGAEE